MSDASMPQHPRPDFHRGEREGRDSIDLNGSWAFCFDEGGDEGAGEDPRTGGFDRRIRVPFPWQSHLAWGTEGEAGNEDYYSTAAFVDPAELKDGPKAYRDAEQYEIGWYRRQFRIPDRWRDYRTILKIGAADWLVAVWCNGAYLGNVESAYLPVEFDLTDAIAAGDDNELIMRVFDPMEHGHKPVGKQWNWYTRTSGIWQPVWLEPRPDAYIESLKLTPDAQRGTVFTCARAPGIGDSAVLQINISSPGGRRSGHEIECNDGWFAEEIELEEKIRWWPDQPELYEVSATLRRDDVAVDEIDSYFGLRSVSTAALSEDGPNYIHLNGEPIYLRGALDQSFNPWGVYGWPDDDAIRRDVQLAKEAGFNFLRLHIKLEDPRFLYWCDRLGILLQCDLPNFGEWSAEAVARHEHLLRAAIDRDFNHPAIISWCLFNETWGLGGDEYSKLTGRQQKVADLYELAKELDPTRLIEDNSANRGDHVVSDLNSWHFYINDYNRAREHIADVVDRTYPGSEFNYVSDCRQGEEPLINSEYGGISARMGDMDVSWCFKFLTTELRKHQKICGYVYTELQDIEWERNGIYNYDRSGKEFGYGPARVQGDIFVGFDCAPGLTIAPSDTVRVPMFLSCMTTPEDECVTVELQANRMNTLGEQSSVTIEAWHPRQLSAGEIRRTLLPDTTGQLDGLTGAGPGLVAVHATVAEVSDAWNSVIFEVRDGALPQEETLSDGRTVLRKHAGQFEATSAWSGNEIEKGEVGDELHVVSGHGHGQFEYQFEPQHRDEPEKITVLVELSSARRGAPQTSGRNHPTDLQTSLNGIIVDERLLADQPADYRGCLSHIHGLDGIYGWLQCIEVTGRLLKRVVDKSEALNIRLQVPEDAKNCNGVTVYSSRAGSTPCDVTVIIE